MKPFFSQWESAIFTHFIFNEDQSMYDFSTAVIEKLIVHHVGQAAENETNTYSNRCFKASDETLDLLKHYFFSPFKSEQLFQFHHPQALEYNETFQAVGKMMEEPESESVFVEMSKALASQLLMNSRHPKIPAGDFFVAFIRDCIVDDEIADAVGLFKCENKHPFLKVFEQDHQFGVDHDAGININKLDKGCLVFNTEADSGFLVSVVDAVSKKEEARFWKDDFLGLTPRSDQYYQTEQYLSLCKRFTDEMVLNEPIPDRTKQIGMLNKAVSFFQENEVFEEDAFEDEVFEQADLVEKFRSFKENEADEDEKLTEARRFEISPGAVKASRKFIKRVLKLDKNFSLYVHGNGDHIERGFDQERMMNYYKLFFKEEK